MPINGTPIGTFSKRDSRDYTLSAFIGDHLNRGESGFEMSDCELGQKYSVDLALALCAGWIFMRFAL